ncbi:hypothetical protein BUE80_DR010232, partial [Diplocarpon rosae]
VVPKRTNIPGMTRGRGRGGMRGGGRGYAGGRGGYPPARGGGYRGGYRGNRGRGFTPYSGRFPAPEHAKDARLTFGK